MRVMLFYLGHPGVNIPAISLSSLSAYATGQKDIAEHVALTVHNQSFDEDSLRFLGRLDKEKPDLVGFSCYEWNLRRSLELSCEIKSLFPDTVIVLGGPEVSFDAHDILTRHEAVDYVVCGEGEIAFSELLRILLSDRRFPLPAGVTCRQGGEIVHNGFAPDLGELDTLPSIYTEEHMPLKGTTVYFESSRGCPYRCAFCSWGSKTDGHGIRFFSLERIFQDLEILKKRGVKKINFCDASLCLKRERAKKILRFVNQEESFESIAVDVDAGHLEEEIVDLMQPKVSELLIGVQSIHPETLALCQRKWDQKKFEKIVNLVRKSGIHLTFQVIYGLPGDDYPKFLETLDYLASLHPDNIQPFHLQVLPGTCFRAEADSLEMSYSSLPPHYVFRNRSYPLSDVIFSRKIASLIDRIGYGFSWPVILRAAMEFRMSFSSLMELLVSYAEESANIDEEELFSEVLIWPPSKERTLMRTFLALLFELSDSQDPQIYPRLLAFLDYHFLLRMVTRSEIVRPSPAAFSEEDNLDSPFPRLKNQVIIREFPYDFHLWDKQGPLPGETVAKPTSLLFFKDRQGVSKLCLSKEEASLLSSLDGTTTLRHALALVSLEEREPCRKLAISLLERGVLFQ